MLIHWIWLATRPSLSDRIKAELVRHFQDPEAVFFADAESFDAIEGLTKDGLDALVDKNLHYAQKVLDDCDRAGLRILTYQDAAYPARLKNIADPPLVFYYKGRLPDLDGSPVIGVVGTRKASVYGLTAAKRMGYEIAKCGGIVVSGAARGIDASSMQGALTAGGVAVGILGCGADIVYPKENRWLYRDVERYGCIMSEFVPGTPPHPWNFPKRNRVLSGMSCGVLVVEAPEKSGSLITANLAAEQGRDVFVVPGNIDMPGFVGSNRLLQEGAILAATGWNVMSEYEALYPDKVHKDPSVSHQNGYPDEARMLSNGDKTVAKVAQKPRVVEKHQPVNSEKEKKVIDKRDASPYIDLNDKLPKLSEDERKIVSALEKGERLVDDVIAETGLPTGKLLATLTLLEVKGVVCRLPGKRIRLKQAK